MFIPASHSGIRKTNLKEQEDLERAGTKLLMVNYLELPPGENIPEVVNAIIEIPAEDSNKYEYDKKLHVFQIGRASCRERVFRAV